MAETELSIKQDAMKSKQTNSQILEFKSEALQTQRQGEFLWVSEKYFLQGICKFVIFSRQMPQRNTYNQQIQLNCVFNDIVRLDFMKFKTVLSEYQVHLA
jgi:hypothetical protein